MCGYLWMGLPSQVASVALPRLGTGGGPWKSRYPRAAFGVCRASAGLKES